jgi:hypothetical protein
MEHVVSALKNVPLAPTTVGTGGKQYEAAIKLYVASLGKLSEKITAAKAPKILGVCCAPSQYENMKQHRSRHKTK